MYSKTISPNSETKKLSNIYRMSSNKFGFDKNSIIIPKNEFGRLKRDFGFFEAFINTNFSNSAQFFNEDGNYILKKELFPEEMIYFDSNTGEDYVIKRNDMWKVLPKALNDYHVTDRVLGDFLANFLLFKTKNNSLFNPTVPEQETVPRPNGFFVAGPSRAQLKRERRTQREINKLRRELGENFNNNNNNYFPYRGAPMSNENLAKFLIREKREEEIAELKEKLKTEKTENVENLANKLETFYNNRQKIARAIHLTERATANRTKYGSKTGKLPGNLLVHLKQKSKEKRRTKGRRKAAARKTRKQMPVGNNGEYNNENNNE